MNIDLNHFQARLTDEKRRLEGELNELGKKRLDRPNDWEAAPGDTSEISFRDEVADRLEEQDENKEAELSLETELKDVDLALGKISADTYGLCEVDGGPIEIDRLEAKPSARTCKAHLDQI